MLVVFPPKELADSATGLPDSVGGSCCNSVTRFNTSQSSNAGSVSHPFLKHRPTRLESFACLRSAL